MSQLVPKRDPVSAVREASPQPERFQGPHGALIDLADSRVMRDGGDSVSLTRREGQLLWCLASRAGVVLSRSELAKGMSGGQKAWGDRTLDVYISRLRNKIGDLDGTYIQTVRKVGYRLNALTTNSRA